MPENLHFHYDQHVVSLKKLKLMVDDPVVQATLDHILEIAETEIQPCPVHGKLPQINVCVTSSGEVNIQTRTCCDELARSTGEMLAFNQTAYFTPGIRLMLLPEGADRPFIFEGEAIQTLLLGRSDTECEIQPDVDLCDYGAFRNGVSRRHATIHWYRGALHISDEGSSNGTAVNGDVLEPGQPHILRDGDDLRLGHLHVQVMLLED